MPAPPAHPLTRRRVTRRDLPNPPHEVSNVGRVSIVGESPEKRHFPPPTLITPPRGTSSILHPRPCPFRSIFTVRRSIFGFTSRVALSELDIPHAQLTFNPRPAPPAAGPNPRPGCRLPPANLPSTPRPDTRQTPGKQARVGFVWKKTSAHRPPPITPSPCHLVTFSPAHGLTKPKSTEMLILSSSSESARFSTWPSAQPTMMRFLWRKGSTRALSAAARVGVPSGRVGLLM
jgi:hypothetical protein